MTASRNIIILAFVTFFFDAKAQPDTVVLSLEDVLKLARTKSYLAEDASRALETSRTQLNIFKLSNLPTLSLSTTVPNFTHSISSVTQPNGVDAFVTKNQSSSSMNLLINKPVASTGGNLSVSSSLSWINVFGNTPTQSYSSAPFSISYGQSIFDYNPYFDQKRLNGIKERKMYMDFTQALESINRQAAQFYFDLYLEKRRMDLAIQNIKYFEELVLIASQQLQANRLSEVDYIQAELSLLNAKLERKSSVGKIYSSELSLKRFLKINQDQPIKLITNDYIPEIIIDRDKILDHARTIYNLVDYEGRKIQNRITYGQNYSRAVSSDVSISIGTNSSSSNLGTIFRNLQQRQAISLTLKLPIYDWGLRKAQNNVVRIKKEQDDRQIDEDYYNFESQILEELTNLEDAFEYNLLYSKQLELMNKQVGLMQELFNASKIDIGDLGRAINKKTQAQIDLINNNGSFWAKLFSIRSMTLFDPISHSPITLITPFHGN